MAQNKVVAVRSAQDVLLESFKSDMQNITPYLESLLSSKQGVARFVKMTQLAVLRNPGLLSCDKKSLLLAVLWCAERNLEPGVADGAWLIPFSGKVVPVPGFQGLIAKAIEVGSAKSVDAYVVFENDDFQYSYGLEPEMEHTPPKLGAPRGEMIGAYGVVTLPNGDKKFRVMDRQAIERIRDMSAAWKSKPDAGVWFDHPEAMWLKTVTKQTLKTVPMKEALRDLLADDGKLEAGAGVATLLKEAGAEVPPELEGEEDEPKLGAAAKKNAVDTTAFDNLVAYQMEGLPADVVALRMEHLEENIKIIAKNMKKSIPEFKVYVIPYFKPYKAGDDMKDGYWKQFLAWEKEHYPPAATNEPVEEPEQAPESPVTAGEPESQPATGAEAFLGKAEPSDEFEEAKKNLVREILSKNIPWADLEIGSAADITMEEFNNIKARVGEWKAPKKGKK